MVYLTVLVTKDDEIIVYYSYCKGRANKIVTDLEMPEMFKETLVDIAKPGFLRVSYSNPGIHIDSSGTCDDLVSEDYFIPERCIGYEPICLSHI